MHYLQYLDITALFLPYILLRISILDIFQSILIFIFRAVSELAEALRDSDDIKKERNETQKENKDLRERLEIVEKSLRMKSLQRSTGHSHSHDSAIDSDLQEWETETLDLDMGPLGSQEDLMLDLAGGRDDIHCPVADKPIYVSSIAKGSFLEGKLK